MDMVAKYGIKQFNEVFKGSDEAKEGIRWGIVNYGLTVDGLDSRSKGNLLFESELDKGSKFIFTLPKTNIEDYLGESIIKRVAAAKKEHKDFSIFVIKLEDYSKIEKEFGNEKIQKLFLRI